MLCRLCPIDAWVAYRPREIEGWLLAKCVTIRRRTSRRGRLWLRHLIQPLSSSFKHTLSNKPTRTLKLCLNVKLNHAEKSCFVTVELQV